MSQSEQPNPAGPSNPSDGPGDGPGRGGPRFSAFGPLGLISGAIAAVVIAFAFSDSRVFDRGPHIEPPAPKPVIVDEPVPTTPSVVIVPPNGLDKPAPAPGQTETEKTYAPGTNFALASNGATATGGRNPDCLIDGNLSYTGGSGFATSTIEPAQPFLITLAQPVKLNCIRILLWNLAEERYYYYKLEVSADGQPDHWITVADPAKNDDECRGWQDIHFELQVVKQIRLTGTYNNVNSFFHVVEVEAYRDPPPLTAAQAKPVEKFANEPEF